ncbi:MAG: response regulator transcription factor [Chloroflexi bacterium]|nr:response regulator transcription factor [Chloroflexota bacterium]
MIVDDHSVVRLGLENVFAVFENIEVVCEAGTVADALIEARRCKPDVILMDVRLPDGDGVQACRDILAQMPEVKVLMLTSYSDEEALVASVMAGASGYLLKRSDPARLVEAVERVAAGASLIDPDVTGTILRLVREGADETPDPLAVLSKQERVVLPLVVEGKTNREIASALSLSPHTVKAHVSSILDKLNLQRRVEIAALVAARRQRA